MNYLECCKKKKKKKAFVCVLRPYISTKSLEIILFDRIFLKTFVYIYFDFFFVSFF